jgi:hypothetical protein
MHPVAKKRESDSLIPVGEKRQCIETLKKRKIRNHSLPSLVCSSLQVQNAVFALKMLLLPLHA